MTRAHFLSIVGLRIRAFGAQPTSEKYSRTVTEKPTLKLPKPKNTMTSAVSSILYFYYTYEATQVWMSTPLPPTSKEFIRPCKQPTSVSVFRPARVPLVCADGSANTPRTHRQHHLPRVCPPGRPPVPLGLGRRSPRSVGRHHSNG